MAIINPLKKLYAWQCWNTKTNGSCGTTSSGGGYGYSNYVEVPISSAQLLAIGTTDVQLLPPIAANQYYDFKVIIEFTAGTSAYGIAGGNYFIATPFASIGASFSASSFSAGAPGETRVFGPRLSTTSTYLDSVATGYSPILLTCTGTSPTGGNGTLTVKIWYTVMTIS